MHVNMHGSLTKKFMELMGEYSAVQGRYKKLLRDRVARQVRVVNPNATPEEVEEAVASGGADIFADKILSQADQAAMNAYADVQSARPAGRAAAAARAAARPRLCPTGSIFC